MQQLIAIGELPVEPDRRERTERSKRERRETRHDSCGDQRATASWRARRPAQPATNTPDLHIGTRRHNCQSAPALVQEDEDEQKPACKQAGASWRLPRGHQLVFADAARTFSVLALPQPRAAQLRQTALLGPSAIAVST
jgi:hypothetical protein